MPETIYMLFHEAAGSFAAVFFIARWFAVPIVPAVRRFRERNDT